MKERYRLGGKLGSLEHTWEGGTLLTCNMEITTSAMKSCSSVRGITGVKMLCKILNARQLTGFS